MAAARRGLVAVLVAAAVAGCVDRRLAREFRRRDPARFASPGLQLVLCGTGIGLAADRRATGCNAIVAGGKLFLVDVGPGSWIVADRAGLPVGALAGVFLTKFLADGFTDLDEAVVRSWLAGRHAPLPVFGPPGTARLVAAVNAATAMDAATRLVHHSPVLLPPAAAAGVAHEFALASPEASVVVLDADGLRVSAFSVGDPDEAPSVGYRFDYRNRGIVLAGHARNHPNVVRYGDRADILVHEAVHRPMLDRGMRVMAAVGQERQALLTREVIRYHATPLEAATAARDARVGLLVLTRLAPPLDGALRRWAFLRGVGAVFPNVVIGEDGMRFALDPR